MDVGHFDPFNVPTLEPTMSETPRLLAGPGVPSGRCTWDDTPILCDQAAALIGRGAAVVAPSQTTIPVIYLGQKVMAVWRAYAGGYQGFVPVTAGYVGNGHFIPHGAPRAPRLERRGEDAFDTNFAELNGATGERHLGRIPDWGLRDITGFEKQRFVNDIRKIVEKPKCKEFFRTLFNALTKLNPADPPVAGDLLSMLDIIDNQEGFVRVGNKDKLSTSETGYYSTVQGSAKIGNAAVMVNSLGDPSNHEVIIQDSLTIMHEGMHLAGRLYDDRRLAEAVFQARVDAGLLTTGIHKLPEDEKDVVANSKYWNRYLSTACNPEVNR